MENYGNGPSTGLDQTALGKMSTGFVSSMRPNPTPLTFPKIDQERYIPSMKPTPHPLSSPRYRP